MFGADRAFDRPDFLAGPGVGFLNEIVCQRRNSLLSLVSKLKRAAECPRARVAGTVLATANLKIFARLSRPQRFRRRRSPHTSGSSRFRPRRHELRDIRQAAAIVIDCAGDRGGGDGNRRKGVHVVHAALGGAISASKARGSSGLAPPRDYADPNAGEVPSTDGTDR